jgi:hypothetical protein
MKGSKKKAMAIALLGIMPLNARDLLCYELVTVSMVFCRDCVFVGVR